MNWKSKILPELKRLKIAPLMGGQDLNIENPPFEEADYRVCLVFMGDFFAKMVSASMNQLYNLVKSAEAITGKRIYVDFAYQLDTEDVDVMRELGVPEILGWSSFRTLDEFDLLLPSFSIHYEIMSAYIVWRGAGFPPFFNMRIDREELPLVVGGGNVAWQWTH